jgi:small-conductance mechanosensitive channel
MNDNPATSLAALLTSLTETAIVQIVVIVVSAWLTITLTQHFLPVLAGKFSGRNRLRILASAPVLRLGVIAAAVLLILQRVVEPTLENLIALAGALGLAVGFASKDYLSSLIAGVVASYEMPYRPGDWIEVDGTYGEVRAIGLRTVEIVTPDDTLAHIPHLRIWNEAILNANDGSQYLQCVADFYLHPRHDGVRVLELLRDVALTSPFLQSERPINVIALEKPFVTHYRLKAYPIDPRQQFHFVTDLTVRGKAALIQLGVEFAVASPLANPV